jgi:hypothetical protein
LVLNTTLRLRCLVPTVCFIYFFLQNPQPR